MTLSPKKVHRIPSRYVAAVHALGALLLAVLSANAAGAQSLRITPVNIQISPGQKAATLTMVNAGSSVMAIQIRAYNWSQPEGNEQLTASTELLASPPIASIAPGATQIVRLVLRQAPQGREATYRILLDQIPPPSVPGLVQMAMRMSIPVFALPATRALPHVQFHIERNGEQVYLVAINDGARHEAIRDIVLTTSDGRTLKPATATSPYVLAGVTRRWPIDMQSPLLRADDALQIKAQTDAGAVDQQVRVVGIP